MFTVRTPAAITHAPLTSDRRRPSRHRSAISAHRLRHHRWRIHRPTPDSAHRRPRQSHHDCGHRPDDGVLWCSFYQHPGQHRHHVRHCDLRLARRGRSHHPWQHHRTDRLPQRAHRHHHCHHPKHQIHWRCHRLHSLLQRLLSRRFHSIPLSNPTPSRHPQDRSFAFLPALTNTPRTSPATQPTSLQPRRSSCKASSLPPIWTSSRPSRWR